jgi:hypothetical protein
MESLPYTGGIIEGFENHVSACNFVKIFFESKFPQYRIKLQTKKQSKNNIRIYFVDNWKSTIGHENIPAGWIFRNADGLFYISVEQDLDKYLGKSDKLSEVFKLFEAPSKLYAAMLIDDEVKYYASLQDSPQAKNSLSTESTKYENDITDARLVQAAHAVFVREHGNRYSWGAYMKRIPPYVEVYPKKGWRGQYVGQFKYKLCLFDKHAETADDKVSLPGRFNKSRQPLELESIDSSSISTMAWAVKEIEADKRLQSYFPLDTLHPKFSSLSPTTQKMLALRQSHAKVRINKK